MKRWTVALAVVLAIGMVAGTGYLGLESAQGKDEPAPEAPSTVAVTRGNVQTTVTAPGHLAYTRQSLLAFAVGGTLAEVAVQPGLEVSAGEPIARLDRTPLLAKVAVAEAERTKHGARFTVWLPCA